MDDIISKIKEFVDMFDLLDLCDPPIKYDTREKECQIRCPFHGADTGPSARIYPETNSMYCFACTKSWDPIDFWAEINAWSKEDGTLDRGRSIKDLADRFDIAAKRADWKKSLWKSLNSVKTKHQGYSGADFQTRLKALDSYSWILSKKVSKIPKESRQERWEDVQGMWDELDSLDLAADDWKVSLKSWMKAHRTCL